MCNLCEQLKTDPGLELWWITLTLGGFYFHCLRPRYCPKCGEQVSAVGEMKTVQNQKDQVGTMLGLSRDQARDQVTE